MAFCDEIRRGRDSRPRHRLTTNPAFFAEFSHIYLAKSCKKWYNRIIKIPIKTRLGEDYDYQKPKPQSPTTTNTVHRRFGASKPHSTRH